MKRGRRYELVAPRTGRIVLQEEPEPRLGEALVQVHYNGLCASDLATWQTNFRRGPLTLGHEPVGTVRRVGPGVELALDTLVTGRFLASYADMVLAEVRDIVEVPDGVPIDQALGEPLGCVAEALRRTPIHLADRVAVIGLGYMGLCMTQLLTRTATARITGIDPRVDACKAALDMGADDAYAPENVPDRIRSDVGSGGQRDRHGVDLVIEATGTQPGLDLATALVRPHGRISILGYHQAARQVDVHAWNWKAIDVISTHVRDRDLLRESTRAGLEMISERRIDLTPLLTHRYPLECVDEAFTALETKPQGFIKAVIEVS